MNENLIRKLTCAIKESNCGCNKPKCTCNDSNRKVTDVKILPVQGVPGEKQLIVYYDDCTQATYQYNDPSKDGDTFIEKFKIENSILKGVYNTGEEVQVLNLRNYALARDVRDLANKINHIKGYIFEDVEIDFSCDGTLPSSCCSKPFREGNKVYYINCKGEKEFLFDVTDEKEEELAPTPTPPPAPQPKPKYTIKSRAVNGGITVPSSITVEEGTEVEIGAFVPENKLFKHWTLNNQVVGTGNTIKVIADSNKEYVAIIEDKPSPKPDPVPEQPTPPTPKPTPVITYDIEADTTPVSITIDDTTREKEVCFSYKVVKNTTLEGNTTKEYVSNYTSNRAKDRFCVTTSTNQQLPLEVNVDGTVLNKTFTINVTDNRTPDRGFFEVDYPNSTGIEATPEGPRLINQCYTDGTGGIVTYTIKLTERSNPFVGIPENLPQGIEVTLSEDKKTMTIKTICNVISQTVGKIFDVFDFFKRMISVLIGPFKEPAPTHPEFITVTLRKRYGGGSPLQQTEEKIQVPYGGTFTPEMPEVEDHWREKIASDVPGRENEIYLTHPDYRPTPFTNLTSDITVVLDYVYEAPDDVEQPQPQYNVRYNLTYSFIDYDNSTPINVQGLPTGKEITGVTDLEDGPIYHTITPPEIPGYKFVEFIVEGGTPITMLPYSTNIWNDTNITFKYVKLDTDSYGKPLPFKFSPHIIDYIRFSHPELSSTGNFGSGDYVASMIQKNDFALKVGNKPLDKSWFPITITDGVTTRTYTATDEREYRSNASDIWAKYSTLNIDYQPTANIIVRDGNADVFYVAHYKNFMLKDNNNHPIGGKFINSLTAPGAIEYVYGEDYSAFNREKLYNKSKSKALLPYDKKEITVTIKGEEYKFKPDTIDTVRIVAYSAPKGEYNLMLFPWTIEGHPGLGYADGVTDATVVPIMLSPSDMTPTLPPEDDETPTPPSEPTEDAQTAAQRAADVVPRFQDMGIYYGHDREDGDREYQLIYTGNLAGIKRIRWELDAAGISTGWIDRTGPSITRNFILSRLLDSYLVVNQEVEMESGAIASSTHRLNRVGESYM